MLKVQFDQLYLFIFSRQSFHFPFKSFLSWGGRTGKRPKMKMENWSKSKTLNSTCAGVKILNPTCSIWIPSAAKTVRWNSDFGLQSKLDIFQNIDISTIGHYQLLSEMVKCYRDKHLHQSWDVFLELGHSHCHCSSKIFMCNCRDSDHKKSNEDVIFEGWKI